MEAQHKEHAFRFLMGLNDSYGNMSSQILLIEPFPSLSKVCYLILQEEKWSIGHGFHIVQSSDAMAMYANNSRGFHANQGHNHGGKGNNSKKDRPICTYYGLTGHIADKCYKLHGYPPSYKPKGGKKVMANQVYAILPSGTYGSDGFPSTLSVGLPTAGVLPNVNAQFDMIPTSQNFLSHAFGGSLSQVSP